MSERRQSGLAWRRFLLFHFSIRTRLHVELQSHAVVADCKVNFANTIIAAPAVEEGVGVLQIKFYHLREVLNRLQVLPEPLEGDAAIVQRVDVVLVDRQHLRVVVDCIVVLAQLGVAVSPIVQRFHVVRGAIPHLVGVVLDRSLEALHLTVDEAAVRINYRVRAIKLNGLVEVMDRIFQSTHTQESQRHTPG